MGTQVHHKHLVILNSSLARCPYSTKRYMIHLIHFEREEGVMLVQVDRSPIIAAFLWFLSFLCFLPFPNLSFQAPTSLNKVPLCGLAITKKSWSFIYLFDIYFIATTEPDQDMERTSVQHGQEFLHSGWNILCGLP